MVTLIAAVCYLPALRNGFVGDDQGLVVANSGLTFLPATTLLVQPFGAGAATAHRLAVRYYRPLSSLSLGLDRRLWGLNPFPYHLHNLLLNLICVVLVFLTSHRLLGSWLPAALVGLSFALHPMHAESVAYISGRTDLLMSCFLLIGFLLIAHKPSHTTLILAVIAFALSLLAKETAVMFVPLVALWFLLDPRNRCRESRYLLIALVAVALGFILLRHHVLRQPPTLTPGVRATQYPWLMLNTLGLYLQMLLVPFRHSPYYPLRADFAALRYQGLTTLGLILILVVLLVRNRRLAALGIAWFICFLLPVSNILYLSGPLAAERLLYLPSFGLILALAALATEIRSRILTGVLTTAVLGLMVLFGHNTLNYSRVWHDELTLASAMVRAEPNFALAHSRLGVALRNQGELSAAEQEFRLALKLKPDFAEAHRNLGALYEMRHDIPAALACYRSAVRCDPSDPIARNNLGSLFGMTGELDSAASQFRAALALEPDNAEALNNLAVTLYQTGQVALAEQHLRHALRVQPCYLRALVNLARLTASQGQYNEARDLLRRALAMAPYDPAVQSLARQLQ